MSKIEFPVYINTLHVAHVCLFNKKLEVLKRRLAIYSARSHLICSEFEDIYYHTPKYTVIGDMYNKELFFAPEEKREDIELGIVDDIYIGKFLESIGFNWTMFESDLIALRANVFNGQFPYKNSEIFGYKKAYEMIWKNGIKVPNPMNELSDYDKNKYTLEKNNEFTQLFSLLTEVDYENPNAIFEPFPEEGEIRKRILE